NVVPIHLPPLRERLEDLPLLVDHFLEKIAKASNKEKPRLSQKAMTSLMMHSWPGNVRELENVLERAMILAEGDLIGDIFFSHSPYESRDSATSDAVQLDVDVPLKTVIDRAVENIERTYLTKLLTKHRGSIKLTAAAAQIDVRTVLRKMKQFNLNKGDFKISADESPHRT
ncbi:MAG: two-component system response regulator, partial [Desulfomonilaceae bacterium]